MKLKTKIGKRGAKIILFLLAAMLLGFLLARKQETVTKRGKDNSAQVKQEKIEVSGIKVNDFLKDTEKDASFVTIDKTKDYHVFFIPDQTLFYISITSYPFDKHRGVAESALVEKLGISKEKTCELNVDLTTPYFANPDKAGKVYGLSFCPEGNK